MGDKHRIVDVDLSDKGIIVYYDDGDIKKYNNDLCYSSNGYKILKQISAENEKKLQGIDEGDYKIYLCPNAKLKKLFGTEQIRVSDYSTIASFYLIPGLGLLLVNEFILGGLLLVFPVSVLTCTLIEKMINTGIKIKNRVIKNQYEMINNKLSLISKRLLVKNKFKNKKNQININIQNKDKNQTIIHSLKALKMELMLLKDEYTVNNIEENIQPKIKVYE